MTRPKRFLRPHKPNLKGEHSEIVEGHIYAAGQKKSLSSMFFDWLRPLVTADKAARPEHYGDNANVAQPATWEGK